MSTSANHGFAVPRARHGQNDLTAHAASLIGEEPEPPLSGRPVIGPFPGRRLKRLPEGRLRRWLFSRWPRLFNPPPACASCDELPMRADARLCASLPVRFPVDVILLCEGREQLPLLPRARRSLAAHAPFIRNLCQWMLPSPSNVAAAEAFSGDTSASPLFFSDLPPVAFSERVLLWPADVCLLAPCDALDFFTPNGMPLMLLDVRPSCPEAPADTSAAALTGAGSPLLPGPFPLRLSTLKDLRDALAGAFPEPAAPRKRLEEAIRDDFARQRCIPQDVFRLPASAHPDCSACFDEPPRSECSASPAGPPDSEAWRTIWQLPSRAKIARRLPPSATGRPLERLSPSPTLKAFQEAAE